MKTKFYFLPLFLVMILALSACGQKNTGNNNSDSRDDVIIDLDEENFEEDYEASMEEMFAKGKSFKCTVSENNSEGEMNFIYYIDGKKERFRTEARVTDKTQGLVINSVSIFKDDYNYFWDDLTNKDGMKMKIEDDEDDNDYYQNDSEIEDDEKLDLNERFKLKCSSWRVDENMFDLPKDKSFKDMSELLNSFNAIPEMGSGSDEQGSGAVDYCSFCDLVPAGGDRDECLSSCAQ
ncbi:MAG TPA: hypothetical protein PK142_00545 [bacterium]|nr:hypothetical protein [bacterium]